LLVPCARYSNNNNKKMLTFEDVTGPSNASKAIFFIYDIFGYFPQSIQGADILSTSDKDNQYQVFVPDFFEGKPADISWYVSHSSLPT
jgi:hypothetical protein